ncbi:MULTISPECIES: DUF4488 domain-containing protein [Hwangdonia]|uniref:DUF4488 domain-containing protein n=1 Tax=Hwangdonia seohaensis TaxID=1240727 RepID=A0ABW3RD08_9FLAO|nr:DUF4488 domain-containing protein [Hwangdonia seohaensis]
MKKNIITLFCFIIVGWVTAQEATNQKNILIESNTIVGVWQQMFVKINDSGEKEMFKSGNYKVINSDGTYFTFVTWGAKQMVKNGKSIIEQNVTDVGHYGVYKNLTDSSFIEQIIKHGVNTKMSGTASQINYKLLDINTVIMEYKNGDRWIPEMWRRVVLPNQ